MNPVRPEPARALRLLGLLLATLLLANTTSCEDYGYVIYCPARYPVASGEHGNHYWGLASVHVLASESVETLDTTRTVDVEVYTVDEDTNLWQTGVEVPIIVVKFDLWEAGFCNYLTPADKSRHSLELSGGSNTFICDERAWEYGSDAQLVLRNVGLSSTPQPEMEGAILEGEYTSGGGAERYAVRLYSFEGDVLIPCEDPGALR